MDHLILVFTGLVSQIVPRFVHIRSIVKILILAVTTVYFGCTEEVSFETQNDGHLVVDGFITDQPGPHTVRLWHTAEFTSARDGGKEQPVPGAQVSIYDELGVFVELTEPSPGTYVTPVSFAGEVGKAYSLCIVTPDDRKYISRPEVIRRSSDIESMYYQLANEQVVNSSGNLVPELRINFYTDLTFQERNSFYKWEWDGMYILETTYTEKKGNLENSSCVPFPEFPELVPDFCYVAELPDGGFINVLASNSLSKPNLDRHLVLSKKVDFNWKIRYSMHLIQYAITEDAYEFWQSAQDQKERSGSIFDPTPEKITGNVYNPNDRSEVVLGYFAAYGMQDTRIFVPGLGIADSVSSCLIPLTFPDEPRAGYCCDCSLLHLSQVEPPEFWVD